MNNIGRRVEPLTKVFGILLLALGHGGGVGGSLISFKMGQVYQGFGALGRCFRLFRLLSAHRMFRGLCILPAFFLNIRQLAYYLGQFTDFGESLHGCNGRLCGIRAFEDGCEHIQAFFGKC